ncbi:MAG: SIMPL domain-containing protein [Bryobacteraceae bacterium]
MMRNVPAFCLALLVAQGLQAQLVGQRPTVRASGEGVISVRPDQVQISVGVTTTGQTAEGSANENAEKVTAVLAALRGLLGPAADIRTVGYSVTPNYRFPQGGGIPTLLGYTTNNTVRVTTADLSSAGKIIDAATKAGATTVSGISFALRDPNPQRLQALRLATQQARSFAEAIAQGLGGRLGNVLAADEAVVARASALDRTPTAVAGGAATTTPVESGLIEVRATVVVEAELLGQ